MPDLTNEKSLTERFAEYLDAPKDSLRAKLIEAVSHHEGWEESAISMVDEAIMPVLQATLQREAALEANISRLVVANSTLVVENDTLKQISDSQLQDIEEQAKRLHEAKGAVQREADLKNLLASIMQVPDDVTMGEVRKTMKDALQNEVSDNG